MIKHARCALTAHCVAALLLSVSSLTHATAADAATYYVSASGDDGRSGTAIASSWRSLDRVNRQQFAPGDTVLFEGGRTFSGQLYLDRVDAGRSDLPVTIGSYGSNGRATISNAQGTAILVYNTAGVRIANLAVTGGSRDVNTGIEIGGWNNRSGFRACGSRPRPSARTAGPGFSPMRFSGPSTVMSTSGRRAPF